MPLDPGFRLGPYEILAPLGTGGMGEVYRAKDTRLDRFVAIKVLPHGRTAGPALERFQREARAASALNHPNICTIFDVGVEPPFIAMELLEGETLQQRLIRGPLDVPSLVELALALGRCPRFRARQGDRPPRYQAGQHLPHCARPEDLGLRTRQGGPGLGRSGGVV